MWKKHGFLKEFHPIVYLLLVGTAFVNLFNSMCTPFLAIYLSKQAQMGMGWIGFVIGMGALAGTFGGFIGGSISDRIGRRKVMFGSMFVSALFYLGYAEIHKPILLAILVVLNGFFGSFFTPASRALMGDLTETIKRPRVFSLRYMAVNVGSLLGPMVGLLFGLTGNSLPFFLMACVYGLYLFLLFTMLKRFGIREIEGRQQEEKKAELLQSFRAVGQDSALLLMLVGIALSTIVEGLWSVPMSKYLPTRLPNGATLFNVLLTVNGTVVIVLQPILSRWLEKKSPLQVITLGSLLFALGETGNAFSGNWAMFILSMVVFTIGEVLVLPNQFVMIDNITPDAMRGTYYGAQSFAGVGNFVGPWMSSVLLTRFGGRTMFMSLAAVALLSLLFYKRGRDLHQRIVSQKEEHSLFPIKFHF